MNVLRRTEVKAATTWSGNTSLRTFLDRTGVFRKRVDGPELDGPEIF